MPLLTTREIAANRFFYGDTCLWIPKGNISGTQARFFHEQLELHFRDKDAPALIDLRRTFFIDSAGAEFLEHSRRLHPNLTLVGFPREFDNLPFPIRDTLQALNPAATIETALSLQNRRLTENRWNVRRRYCRFPVEIPVEIFSSEVSAAAMLHDLSLGGGKITSLSPDLMRYLGKAPFSNGAISIAGVIRDPLGREIAARYSSPVLPSHPVHILPDSQGLGVQFAGGPEDPSPPRN